MTPEPVRRNGIVSFGNWLVDTVKFIPRYPAAGNLVAISKIETGLGGCAHNVLVDLARMQTGIPLHAGGCIGRDAGGGYVMDEIRRHGIDDRHMHVLDGEATSYTDVMSETGGSATRTFFHFRGANARLSPEHILAFDSPARIFHLGYLLLLDELDKPDAGYGVVAARVLHELRGRGFLTSVDVVSEEGGRFRSVVLPCLPHIDYLIVNEVEAGACCCLELRDAQGAIVEESVREAALMLLGEGVGRMCVIHFPEGAFGVERGGGECYVPSIRMPQGEIVSAVGAGDAFCAAMLYCAHERIPLCESLQLANSAARFNLSSPTSTAGMPPVETIRRFMENNYKNQRT